jgi:hypothetical protein
MKLSRPKMLLLSLVAAWLLALPVSLSSASPALAAPLAPLASCEDSQCH